MGAIQQLFDRLIGQASPDLVWQDESGTVSRADLHAQVDACTDLLTAHGITPGDTVAIKLPPCATLFATLLATWRLHARAMLLDHRLTEGETARIVRLCAPTFIVSSERALVVPVVGRCPVRVRRQAAPSTLPEHVCLVQITSGSTGQPKIIGRTALELATELHRYAALEAMPDARDRLLLLCSPVHTWGLIGGVLHGLSTGTPILFPSAIHGAGLAQAAQRLDATAIFGVPVHFDLLSQMTAPPPLPRLRIAVTAGGMAGTELTDRFERMIGCRLGHVYGLTETGVVTGDLVGRHRPPATGEPASGMRLRVDDGELWIRLDRSPYLVDDGVDRFVDGWLRTFDRASLDEVTGVVRILGRADSVISVGGLKVDLTEVEQTVSGHPQVTAAVATFGEVIELHAAVSGGLTAGELAAWCRQWLSAVKVPKRYYLTDRIPTTTTGKVIRDRARLHAAYAASQDSAGRDGAT